jgi:hypothetical protein
MIAKIRADALLYYQYNDQLAIAYLRSANDQGACFAQSGSGFQQ